jgi:cobalt-zinc-cadmium efflux system outer membrane protein
MAKLCELRRIALMAMVALGGCYGGPEAYLEGPTLAAAEMLIPAEDGPQIIAHPTSSAGGTVSVGDRAPYAGGLTLRDAIRRALRFSPAVQAAQIEIDAKRAENFQAGLRPNPELAGEVQNVGQDEQQATLELAQLIELGGKRLKRIRASELEVGVAVWDYEAARLRVASNTAQAFVDVLASQSRVDVLTELLAVSQKLSKAAAERVQAGAAHAVEAPRAEIEVARARAELRAEKALAGVALQRLANNWGSESADFGRAEGQLASTNHLPSPGDLSVHLDSNPDIARWATEMTRREALANIARANAVPDLTIGAGVSRLESGDETGALVNFSIPLPLRNRNQGNIAAAQTRVSKGYRESLSAKIDVRAVFLEAYGRLTAAAEKLEALEKEVLPAAQEVYQATSEGYGEGKFALLNVLDAQRTLFATRLEIINVRADFQKAKVQIEALIGRGLYDA